MTKFSVVLLILCFSTYGYGQSPYNINWKKESGYLILGGGSIGLASYIGSKMSLLTINDIENLSNSDVNSLDRFAIDNYSNSAKKASDFLVAGSYILPGLLLTNNKIRSDIGSIAILYGETILISSGLTQLSKNTFRRTRPFVYNEDIALEKKQTPNARKSFISGHTSFTAANSFFMAKVFSDYHPNSKLKPLVWGLAITIPAATAYFRVEAGKHFPTDVIAGYAVGAAVGYFIPHLHLKDKRGKGLTFHGGPGGILLQYRL